MGTNDNIHIFEVMISEKMKQRLKALGVAGFLFFFLKGLAWLAVFYWAGKGCSEAM